MGCLLVCWLVSGGCRPSDSRLEQALSLAGENRKELEQVLDHYRQEPLKLQAAKFLIENMPGHLSYRGEGIERYYDAVDSVLQEGRGTSADDIVERINGLEQRFPKEYATVSDLKALKSGYLIANIDSAFSQWENGSWSAHLSFSDFCEWLLPYKVMELQALDGWRTYLKGRYDEGLEKLRHSNMRRKSALWAARRINTNLRDSVKPHVDDSRMPPVHRLSTKLRMPFGICLDYSEIAAAVLRSEGVPAAVDFTPLWPFREAGHSWNVVLANNGRIVPFDGCETKPGDPHRLDEKKSKVYRYTYALNPALVELHKSGTCLPPVFRTLCLKDVTREYTVTSDVEVEVNGDAGKYAYLATFDNKSWKPVAFGKVRRRKALFRDLGRDVLYLPVGFRDDAVVPLGNPFVLTSRDEVREIVPRKDSVHPVVMEKIVYTPINDGDTICAGDKYELFYWDDGKWSSRGCRTAASGELCFKDVPAGALLLLRNLSQGVNTRIFLYKDGVPEFW